MFLVKKKKKKIIFFLLSHFFFLDEFLNFVIDIVNCFSYCYLPAVAIPEYI